MALKDLVKDRLRNIVTSEGSFFRERNSYYVYKNNFYKSTEVPISSVYNSATIDNVAIDFRLHNKNFYKYRVPTFTGIPHIARCYFNKLILKFFDPLTSCYIKFPDTEKKMCIGEGILKDPVKDFIYLLLTIDIKHKDSSIFSLQTIFNSRYPKQKLTLYVAEELYSDSSFSEIRSKISSQFLSHLRDHVRIVKLPGEEIYNKFFRPYPVFKDFSTYLKGKKDINTLLNRELHVKLYSNSNVSEADEILANLGLSVAETGLLINTSIFVGDD